ncbi:proline-rich protein 2-like [Panicum virgatum]|uniref:proline-rich protein 2-like n=1 Tax=Panicum virgatum TaxID=38727 RepID=UPI0019D537E8|nr:proline-rich protein 2-like [Panicum virgatum]
MRAPQPPPLVHRRLRCRLGTPPSGAIERAPPPAGHVAIRGVLRRPETPLSGAEEGPLRWPPMPAAVRAGGRGSSAGRPCPPPSGVVQGALPSGRAARARRVRAPPRGLPPCTDSRACPAAGVHGAWPAGGAWTPCMPRPPCPRPIRSDPCGVDPLHPAAGTCVVLGPAVGARVDLADQGRPRGGGAGDGGRIRARRKGSTPRRGRSGGCCCCYCRGSTGEQTGARR